ncbi:MAG TPA: hypothetical protein V6D17_19575 [Candidatus Obscuribacterales bacterium]
MEWTTLIVLCLVAGAVGYFFLARREARILSDNNAMTLAEQIRKQAERRSGSTEDDEAK